jgi:geranylgeranyl diphosphate synthase type I
VRGYRALGWEYGLAFQIRDDVLGVWGSTDATGKVVANDIARRKWSYPVVWALGGPRSPARDLVAAAYERRESLEPQTVARVIDALDELGAREAANRAVEEHLAAVERHPAVEVRNFLIDSLQIGGPSK